MVLHCSEVSGGVRADIQVMYNHRMEPTRQAVALHNLAQLINQQKRRLSLDGYDEELVIQGFYLTSTTSKSSTKMDGGLLAS